MDTKQYTIESARTAASNHTAIRNRFASSDMLDLVHSGLGMATEAAEFQDALKKHLYYGRELDTVNLVEELGDMLFYIAWACRVLNVPMDKVMETNIAKLHQRYPERFTEEDANLRYTDLEREEIAAKIGEVVNFKGGILK